MALAIEGALRRDSPLMFKTQYKPLSNGNVNLLAILIYSELSSNFTYSFANHLSIHIYQGGLGYEGQSLINLSYLRIVMVKRAQCRVKYIHIKINPLEVIKSTHSQSTLSKEETFLHSFLGTYVYRLFIQCILML